MNYSQFDPANVNFGNPNEPPSNPYGTQALNIPQVQEQQQSTQPQTQQSTQQQKANTSFSNKIKIFLNSKTGPILSTSIGIAIGFAFKDLIASIVTNILQPLVIKMISLSSLNNYYDFNIFITQERHILNISKFFAAIFTFVFTVITIYYLSKFILFI
jgi:large-conductance mechanosensitive channel